MEHIIWLVVLFFVADLILFRGLIVRVVGYAIWYGVVFIFVFGLLNYATQILLR